MRLALNHIRLYFVVKCTRQYKKERCSDEIDTVSHQDTTDQCYDTSQVGPLLGQHGHNGDSPLVNLLIIRCC